MQEDGKGIFPCKIVLLSDCKLRMAGFAIFTTDCIPNRDYEAVRDEQAHQVLQGSRAAPCETLPRLAARAHQAVACCFEYDVICM